MNHAYVGSLVCLLSSEMEMKLWVVPCEICVMDTNYE